VLQRGLGLQRVAWLGSLVEADGTAEVCDGEAGVDLERCVEVGDGVSVLFADSKRGTALPTTESIARDG
jgi:hypothetical protein